MTEENNLKDIIEIPRHLHDARFDAALFSLLQEKYPEKKALSRTFLHKLILAKKITLNDAFVKPSTQVSFQDKVIFLGESLDVNKEKKDVSEFLVQTIFEDDNIIVINKPGNIKMHASGESREITVADWILKKYPELDKVGEDALRPGIVHRLDRETSGVVVLAKNNKSFQELKKVFQEREMEKTYIALVYGNLSKKEGKIDFSLTRTSGELKRRAVDAEEGSGELSGNVRTAITFYNVLMRYTDFDLLEIKPKTGRTHQIRVHFSALGHPVVGDKLYAFKPAKRGELFFSKRHLLHALKLSFTLFGKKYAFSAPLPEDIKRVLLDIDPVTYEDALSQIEKL